LTDFRVVNYYYYLIIVYHHPLAVTAADNLQMYLKQLELWLTSNRMAVSAPKSSINPHYP